MCIDRPTITCSFTRTYTYTYKYATQYWVSQK